MRISSAVAALVVLLAPALTVAETGEPEGTVTSYTATTTVTMTLVEINATTTIHYSSKPSSWNATSTLASSETGVTSTPLLYYTAYPSSASATKCENCMLSGAGSEHVNIAVAAVLGAAALAWGSL